MNVFIFIAFWMKFLESKHKPDLMPCSVAFNLDLHCFFAHAPKTGHQSYRVNFYKRKTIIYITSEVQNNNRLITSVCIVFCM